MSTSAEPESERTELSTQDLPEIPAVETLLRWIKNLKEGRKRKGDETDASESSISPKRIRQEAPLCGLATRAREQRQLVREIITKLNSSSDQHPKSDHPLPGAIDKLSNPKFEHILAFPFIGRVPVRFKLDNKAEENWPYVGRVLFRKLLEELKTVRESKSLSVLWLYGTQGYGKSHLLAVLVCYLAAQDERVVYIPDCREWLRSSVGYIKKAMLFAWADDIATLEEIEKLTTETEITTFFDCRANVLVVADQLNALTESGCTPEEAKERKDLHKWLMRFSYEHTAVFSSSANYKEFLDKSKAQTSYRVIPAYGGLERVEMDQWWEQHKVGMGGYTKPDVEDVTGCIPLLLDKCVVDGKIDLTVTALRDIYNKAADFVQTVRAETKTPLEWQWYLDYVKACFYHKSPPSGEHFDLIDHRYFYDLNGSGRCVCGLVRDAVAEQLLQWGDNFIDSKSLGSLDDFINNRPVVGFMMEHAILSSIRSKGLAIDAGIGRPMKVKLLAEPSDIETDIRNEPVLYWPQKSNFKIIDGIIILINPEELNDNKNAKKIAEQNTKRGAKKDVKVERDKLLMFPLQITLSRAGHSDSHKEFFKEYRKWTKHLSNFDVEIQFIWITPEGHSLRNHPRSSAWPAHTERYIPFEDISREISRRYQNATRMADAPQGESTGCSTASGNITADEKSSTASGNITADEKSSTASDNITADEKSSTAPGNITADKKSSTAPGNITADEKSSSSPEVTEAAPSTDRKLRPRPGTRRNKH